MIPCFVIPALRIGPLALQPFGILSAAGILLASQLLVREARRRGLDAQPLEKVATWAVVGGIVGALPNFEELKRSILAQLLQMVEEPGGAT